MRRPTRALCVAATAFWLTGGLVACGGGDGSSAGPADGATSLPQAPASDHTSDDASGQESDDPAPAYNQENPQRFIARWAAAEARMQNTGKTAAYLALSQDCVACRHLAHAVQGYYAAGGFIHGGGWRIESIRMSASSGGYPTYAVRAHTAPSDVRESSSGEVLHLPSAPVAYQIGLQADGDSFTVVIRERGV